MNCFHNISEKTKLFVKKQLLVFFSTWIHKSYNVTKPFFKVAKEQQLKKVLHIYFVPFELKKQHGQTNSFFQKLAPGLNSLCDKLHFSLGGKFDN